MRRFEGAEACEACDQEGWQERGEAGFEEDGEDRGAEQGGGDRGVGVCEDGAVAERGFWGGAWCVRGVEGAEVEVGGGVGEHVGQSGNCEGRGVDGVEQAQENGERGREEERKGCYIVG